MTDLQFITILEMVDMILDLNSHATTKRVVDTSRPICNDCIY